MHIRFAEMQPRNANVQKEFAEMQAIRLKRHFIL